MGLIIWYILDNNNKPVSVDIDTYHKWNAGKPGLTEKVGNRMIGDVQISTVFLGLDHNHFGGGPPILWETMIFNWDGEEEYQERYTSHEDALAGHLKAVKLVRDSILKVVGNEV